MILLPEIENLFEIIEMSILHIQKIFQCDFIGKWLKQTPFLYNHAILTPSSMNFQNTLSCLFLSLCVIHPHLKKTPSRLRFPLGGLIKITSDCDGPRPRFCHFSLSDHKVLRTKNIMDCLDICILNRVNFCSVLSNVSRVPFFAYLLIVLQGLETIRGSLGQSGHNLSCH